MTTDPFDAKAATWDEDPAKVERARAVAGAIRRTVALDRRMRLLEYGAGTGLVTQELRDAVGPVTLADTSQGMLDVLRSKVASGALTEARVWELDLSRDPVPAERFDLVVSVMTLHHIPDLAPVLRAFATLLEAGGHLCVADLDREDGSFHDYDFEGHNGFDRDDLAARLAAAGFDGIRFETCHRMPRNDRTYDLFLATATRAPAAEHA